MKKKLFIILFIISIFTFPAAVSAEQKSELPVTLIKNNYYGNYTTSIDHFDVVSVDYLSETHTRIGYTLDYTNLDGNGHLYLLMNCYEEQGYLIETVELNVFLDYVDVPYNTAAIEITTANSDIQSDSYLYSKYITMYAPDGSSVWTSIFQIPVYEKMGWCQPVTMFEPATFYSIEISPFEVPAYEEAGGVHLEALYMRWSGLYVKIV